MNLYAALRAEFPSDLDAVAIETDAGLYTWRDLERGSAMLANVLDSLDLEPGSRIAAQTDKSVEALLLYLATLRAGHIYLPLNTAYQRGELEHFLDDAEPAVLVCRPQAFSWLSTLAFRRRVGNVFTLDESRGGTLLERAAQMSDRHQPAASKAGDLAAIIYTSGTTGVAKGAMLSHGNLLSNAQVLKDYWDWRAGDVLIHALPIFHVHGLFVAAHGALLAGARMLWLAKFDAKDVLARLPLASVFMGVPTLYVRLLAEPGLTPEACRTMRLFVCGSAPLLRETFARFREATGHTLVERYGMSETVILTSNPVRPADGAPAGGSVGRALPGVEVRISDAQGRPCPSGEVGAIEVRGPSVFSGYWRMPEKTAAEFTPDGWFRTGDLGQLDTTGALTIVGRSKDLIISGGYNVYPAEVEDQLNALPGVGESAVVGVPHPDFGEVSVALVVPQPGATLDAPVLLAALKERIANYKVPKRAFVVAELPRNAMGKVQKALLRKEHSSLFSPPVAGARTPET